MNDPTLLESLLAWLPLVVILLVFFLWGRSANKAQRKHVDEVNALNQQILDINRDMIAELKEIKLILKDQN